MYRLFAVLLTPGLLVACCQAHERDADISRLIKELNPPARFEEHRPQWSLEECEFTFEDFDGPVTVPWYFIKDGQRYVAMIPRALFQSGCIYLLDFRPGHGPESIEAIKMPTERWHIETTIGTEFRTDAFIPTSHGNKPESFAFEIEGSILKLTRKYKGETTFNKWAHQAKEPVFVDTVNTFTLSVDRQLGYVVSAHYDTWTSQQLKGFEYLSAADSGRHSTWPDEISSFRIAISTVGAAGFHGYATNMGCTRRHRNDGVCRDGGFVAFLNDRTGWSPAYENGSGVDSRLVVCGPHTDHDFTLPMDKLKSESKDGLDRYVVGHRMFALPPELTAYVWQQMKLLHADEQQVLMRIGQLEDFEDQPLILSGRQRGHPIGGEISKEHAYSGTQALKFEGSVSLGSPTLCLKPNRKYLLETRIKFIPWDQDKRAAYDQAQQDRYAEQKKRYETALANGKSAKEPPPAEPLGFPEAGLTARFNEWDGGREKGEPIELKTERSGEWVHLQQTFTAQAWGPAIKISFYGRAATVYVDDFRLTAVE